jgi:hypothetical protein
MSEPAGGAVGAATDERFDRPLLIVSPPRSGSTLLFETMEQAPGLFSIGTESHIAIESIPAFHPGNRMWHSNRLTAAEAATPAARRLADGFYSELRDRDGHRPDGPARMIEKTPKNALRIPFFAALWPDSAFIYLYRDVRQTLASMMEAWASSRFITYPHLPGWTGYRWSLLLVRDGRRSSANRCRSSSRTNGRSPRRSCSMTLRHCRATACGRCAMPISWRIRTRGWQRWRARSGSAGTARSAASCPCPNIRCRAPTPRNGAGSSV